MAWFPLQCWLILPDGKRIEVDDRGLLAGRGPGADLPVPDQNAARRLLLVCLEMTGPVAIPVASTGFTVNDVPMTERHNLLTGDRLCVAGLELKVETRSRPRNVPSGWILRHARSFVQVPQGPFRIGGTPDDDLRIPGWPAAVLRLHFRHGALHLESEVEILLNESPTESREPVILSTGDRIRCLDEFFQLLEIASSNSIGGREEILPTKVVLQPLPPAGGQITVGFSQGESTIFLDCPEFDLAQMLLVPPGAWNPGEPIPDTALAPKLFANQSAHDAMACSKLVHRLRATLERGGVDGASILSRAGGQVAFRIARNAAILSKPPR